MNKGQIVPYAISGDGVTAGSFEVSGGNPSVATISPTSISSAKEGIFTITGKNAGTTAFTFFWSFQDGSRSGSCSLTATVIKEEPSPPEQPTMESKQPEPPPQPAPPAPEPAKLKQKKEPQKKKKPDKKPKPRKKLKDMLPDIPDYDSAGAGSTGRDSSGPMIKKNLMDDIRSSKRDETDCCIKKIVIKEKDISKDKYWGRFYAGYAYLSVGPCGDVQTGATVEKLGTTDVHISFKVNAAKLVRLHWMSGAGSLAHITCNGIKKGSNLPLLPPGLEIVSVETGPCPLEKAKLQCIPRAYNGVSQIETISTETSITETTTTIIDVPLPPIPPSGGSSASTGQPAASLGQPNVPDSSTGSVQPPIGSKQPSASPGQPGQPASPLAQPAFTQQQPSDLLPPTSSSFGQTTQQQSEPSTTPAQPSIPPELPGTPAPPTETGQPPTATEQPSALPGQPAVQTQQPVQQPGRITQKTQSKAGKPGVFGKEIIPEIPGYGPSAPPAAQGETGTTGGKSKPMIPKDLRDYIKSFPRK